MITRQSVSALFKRNRQILIYGLILGGLVTFLKIVEYRFLIKDHALEIYMGILAIVFTVLGVWMGLKMTKTVTVEKIIPAGPEFQIDGQQLDKLGISKREYEVLLLMAEGMSNREIAEKLFVSPHTIKTHTSNLFIKLDADRRTQAVNKAKTMFLIP